MPGLFAIGGKRLMANVPKAVRPLARRAMSNPLLLVGHYPAT